MLRVIGAGFGRTGTLSLKVALERLGFGPCYHMTEVFRHPAHGADWLAAAAGALTDWERIFAGYGATTDWPGCSFYAELMRAYPEAKVVLTVRDPNRWYESVRSTIYRASHVADGAPPGPGPQVPEALVWQSPFSGRFEDRAHAVGVFEGHNREVRERVPADRLLVFDVAEGWGPLCRFLGTEVPPGEPFPHVKLAQQFVARLGRQLPPLIEGSGAADPAPGDGSP